VRMGLASGVEKEEDVRMNGAQGLCLLPCLGDTFISLRLVPCFQIVGAYINLRYIFFHLFIQLHARNIGICTPCVCTHLIARIHLIAVSGSCIQYASCGNECEKQGLPTLGCLKAVFKTMVG
jgi:hypothetical protein